MENYQTLELIGKGSYGKVFKVRCRLDGKSYVMKRMNIDLEQEEEREAALGEVRLLSSLQHPNIVSYKESFYDDKDNLCIVMSYCEAGDLHDRIQTAKQNGAQFSEEQILDWFVQMCLGLSYIHSRKIVHRDLKSKNIFLTSTNMIKIGDFGIARVLHGTMDMARTLIGSPYYMSPEMCQNRPYNQKSDVWALGCVLYEMCTLKHAFTAQHFPGMVLKILRGSYPAIPASYSQPLRDLISTMLARAPEQRPAVAQILALPLIRSRGLDILSRIDASRGNTPRANPVATPRAPPADCKLPVPVEPKHANNLSPRAPNHSEDTLLQKSNTKSPKTTSQKTQRSSSHLAVRRSAELDAMFGLAKYQAQAELRDLEREKQKLEAMVHSLKVKTRQMRKGLQPLSAIGSSRSSGILTAADPPTGTSAVPPLALHKGSSASDGPTRHLHPQLQPTPPTPSSNPVNFLDDTSPVSTCPTRLVRPRATRASRPRPMSAGATSAGSFEDSFGTPVSPVWKHPYGDEQYESDFEEVQDSELTDRDSSRDLSRDAAGASSRDPPREPPAPRERDHFPGLVVPAREAHAVGKSSSFRSRGGGDDREDQQPPPKREVRSGNSSPKHRSRALSLKDFSAPADLHAAPKNVPNGGTDADHSPSHSQSVSLGRRSQPQQVALPAATFEPIYDRAELPKVPPAMPEVRDAARDKAHAQALPHGQRSYRARRDSFRESRSEANSPVRPFMPPVQLPPAQPAQGPVFYERLSRSAVVGREDGDFVRVRPAQQQVAEPREFTEPDDGPSDVLLGRQRRGVRQAQVARAEGSKAKSDARPARPQPEDEETARYLAEWDEMPSEAEVPDPDDRDAVQEIVLPPGPGRGGPYPKHVVTQSPLLEAQDLVPYEPATPPRPGRMVDEGEMRDADYDDDVEVIVSPTEPGRGRAYPKHRAVEAALLHIQHAVPEDDASDREQDDEEEDDGEEFEEQVEAVDEDEDGDGNGEVDPEIGQYLRVCQKQFLPVTISASGSPRLDESPTHVRHHQSVSASMSASDDNSAINLSDRGDRLRSHCIAGLGDVVFGRVYNYLKGRTALLDEDDDMVLRIELSELLGEDNLPYWPIIEELIFCERGGR